jgi:hypothetical protein
MSDKPLFQNTDEQEAIYAPQQLPAQATDRQATNTEASASGDTLAPVEVVPTAGVAFEAAGIGTGAGVSSGTAGTAGGILPAVGAVALAQETEKPNTHDGLESERR